MIISKVSMEMYPEVRLFYHSLIDALEGEYRPMWQKDIYPSPEDLKQAISEGTLYTGCENGQIAAAMVVNHKNNEAYKNAKWETGLSQDEYLVIHMLGVHSKFARRGFAKEMVRFAMDLARSEHTKAVRLDVLKGNLPANRLYEGLGFYYVDTVDMFYEDTGWMVFELYEYQFDRQDLNGSKGKEL